MLAEMKKTMDLSKIPPSPLGSPRQHFNETLELRNRLEMGIMKVDPELQVDGDIEYMDGEIALSAYVRGVQSFDCSRCLEPIERPFEKYIFLTFDCGTELIDAVPDIREEVMVDSPINVLCREDCRGLCDQCGANLNLGPCKCKQGGPSA